MIVLDTCAVVWMLGDSSLLSSSARGAIEESGVVGGVFISGITLYELAWLIKNNRLASDISLDAFFKEVESKCLVLPISSAIARLAVELPNSYPKDPMDRIIGATALDRGIPLVTRDRGIRNSKAVPVIW
ncbi:MAG TPA: type II toxin-antitoxin system VapC family toxin [Acidisarcina sp.]